MSVIGHDLTEVHIKGKEILIDEKIKQRLNKKKVIVQVKSSNTCCRGSKYFAILERLWNLFTLENEMSYIRGRYDRSTTAFFDFMQESYKATYGEIVFYLWFIVVKFRAPSPDDEEVCTATSGYKFPCESLYSRIVPS